MRLGARAVAGVPRMATRIIKNDELRRREALAKSLLDQLFDGSLTHLRHDCPLFRRPSKLRARVVPPFCPCDRDFVLPRSGAFP